jgi:hypothetical protein
MRLFVDLDGAVYGCGSNANGQLGDSTTAGATSARPGPVRGSLAVPALAVAAGRNTSAAVGADGSVWVWGQVPNGAAGDGGPTTGTGSLQFLAPQPVVGAAGSGRFDAGPVAAAPALFTGTQTGALGRATVNVGLSPLPADVGAEGRVYLAAVLPDGSLYLYSDATGWQPGAWACAQRTWCTSRRPPSTRTAVSAPPHTQPVSSASRSGGRSGPACSSGRRPRAGPAVARPGHVEPGQEARAAQRRRRPWCRTPVRRRACRSGCASAC